LAHGCEFFPCHEPWENDMTCDNCYCPIYEQNCKPMGGNPKFINNKKREIIKDCSECKLPHKKGFKNNS